MSIERVEIGFEELPRCKNRESFNYLYDQYSSSLFGEIIRTVKDQQVAEDLLQEVFISIYQHGDCYDPKKGRLFTWMITIAKNKCIDYFRSAAYRKNRQGVPLFEIMVTKDPRLLSALEFSMIYKRISVSCPGSLRIMKLVYVHGFTQDEVAAICQIPVGTVKTRIKKTLSTLREFFQASEQY